MANNIKITAKQNIPMVAGISITGVAPRIGFSHGSGRGISVGAGGTGFSGPVVGNTVWSRIVVYSANNEHTRANNFLWMDVYVLGPGASGGSATANSIADISVGGGGGGAGGIAIKKLFADDVANLEPVFVYSGMSAFGNSSSAFTQVVATPGSSGSNSSAISATGGTIGDGGTGGTATGGDLNFSGAAGESGFLISGICKKAGSTGGDSFFSGKNYGAGGDGAFSNSSLGLVAGNSGNSGVVIIIEYYNGEKE